MNARANAVVLAALAALALAGCRPADPFEKTVSAESGVMFNVWRSRFANATGPDERRRFEDALQEIRLKIMADGEASGSAGIDEALRRKIHGRPVREVVQLGLESRLLRLRADASALRIAIRQNVLLVTRPGDVASENYLVDVRQKQSARLDKLESDIAAAERELAPLQEITGRPLIPPPEDTPDEMPVRLPPAKRRY